MSKRLVMWGTFLAVFFASAAGSYKFINRNNQDLTIELSAPTLPLVSVCVGENSYNVLHGYTSGMDADDVAEYIVPLGKDRMFSGQIQTLGEKVQSASYEIRNINGTRLIENGSLTWVESTPELLSFQVKMKDLIEQGEAYIFTVILQTSEQKEIRYYTRFIYDDSLDIETQLAFVMQFHDNTLQKDKISELSPYMESNSSADNTNLAYVDIHSSAKQVIWGDLEVEQVTEPTVYITYLQDQYGAYTLEYYVSSTVDEVVQYYHVEEDFLVSAYGETLYLLDYERTADTIFSYEEERYQNNKIDLGIQSETLSVAESDDGNMAAFVVNGELYYYDDVENQINYVYGFWDNDNKDERSNYFRYDMKVLQIDEAGSMYFLVYGYMNRGNYEGKTGVALYAYDGQNKLVEEIGFWESDKCAEYVMQEVETLSYLSRKEKFYCCKDGNIFSYDLKTGETTIELAYDESYEIYISESNSCIAVDYGESVDFWNLESAAVRTITAEAGVRIVPQGFIADDFVYGLYHAEDGILQSDGTYAQYMQEIRIQDANGTVLKTYQEEGIYICQCTIVEQQLLLERVTIEGGTVKETTSDQIVASKGTIDYANSIQSAVTKAYQTIWQVSLKHKIDVADLKKEAAKEVFYEGSRNLSFEMQQQKPYCRVYSPWRICMYTADASEAVLWADTLGGMAKDSDGAILWRKEASSTKNQIMAIELETADAERTSKQICLDIMLRQAGNPFDSTQALAEGKTCQEILDNAPEEYALLDITDVSLEALLYYVDRDIPVMVLYDNAEAALITGFNQFNIVVMDPVNRKLGYMSRSDAKEMLETTQNQVFTYYEKKVN